MTIATHPPSLKAPLSRELFEAYTKLIHQVSALSEKQFFAKTFKGTGGIVSPADLLAYQIGWGHLLIEWYESGIHNRQMIMPGEGFSRWEYTAIAKHFYQKYATCTLSELKNAFHLTVQRVIDMIEKEYATGHLDALGVWGWCQLQSGKEWPLSKWIKINTIAPYKRALKILKEKSDVVT